MSTYSEIYLVLNGKRYDFDKDLDFTCAKSLTTWIEESKMDECVKQTYFLDSFLGEKRVGHRSYIFELDIPKWLTIEGPEDYPFTAGFFSALCKLEGARIFFRNEHCDCLGAYGEDTSDKYKEKGWAIEYE